MSSCCGFKKSSVWPLVIIFAVLGGVMWYRGRHAPMPALFEQGITIEAAYEQSAQTGKPIFVLATADWCPSCQTLKRGALSDEQLIATFSERAIPVYLDISKSTSPGAEFAAQLGVTSIPAMFVIADGQVVASTVGARSAGYLLDWFDRAQSATPSGDW